MCNIYSSNPEIRINRVRTNEVLLYYSTYFLKIYLTSFSTYIHLYIITYSYKELPSDPLEEMVIIIAVEKNEKLKTLTKTKIAENFQIPKTTLSTIIRNKSKITEAFQQSQFEPGRKRVTHSYVRRPRRGFVELDWDKQGASMCRLEVQLS